MGMAATDVGASAANDVARRVFVGLPRRYDRLAYLLSFGQDRRWRRAVVEEVATVGPRQVLDVATGPAGVALAVARRTGASVVGVDLNLPMLAQGRDNVRRAGDRVRVNLVAGRAERLPMRDESVDAVTFAYLLRYVDDPAATLAELARCLRPGGVMAGLEFAVPPAAGWRALWRAYTAAVLPILGWLTGGPAWWRVGRFLGPSIRAHYADWPLDRHVRAWQAAGLHDVGCRRMSVGGGLVMWGTKAAPP
jgi:demethylmenaquinone methyltransferase / 2-methoxy-6-polyprenyl-1,4-benzoquinol methylase